MRAGRGGGTAVGGVAHAPGRAWGVGVRVVAHALWTIVCDACFSFVFVHPSSPSVGLGNGQRIEPIEKGTFAKTDVVRIDPKEWRRILLSTCPASEHAFSDFALNELGCEFRRCLQVAWKFGEDSLGAAAAAVQPFDNVVTSESSAAAKDAIGLRSFQAKPIVYE